MSRSCDILIVGAGIIGLTLARELVERGHEDILIIEKEADLGRHASGRNSGVLHAGIYYAPGSLRAVSCLQGNRMMKEYCRAKDLPLLETGKVIVARSADELPTLDELHRRATENGTPVEFIDEKQLAHIEPSARTVERALHSPETALVDPKAVLSSLRRDLEGSGKVSLLTDCTFRGLASKNVIRTGSGEIGFRYLINAAGAWCDRVARPFGVGHNYRLIPFKGLYHRLKESSACQVKGNIYPVPDIRNPFLGVHFSRSAMGGVYLGPTAIPAFGRENYGLLEGIDAEAPKILYEDAVLFCTNPKFRSVALSEPKKYLPSAFHRDAEQLVHKLEPADIELADKVGIRAQLVDWRSREMVMDFLVESGENSLHILNPISPAFTSSMFLARKLVEEYVST
ncbi:MAG: L-2-hydroxyglutarate oxidase [Desulfuromonadales bacterium]|nr:L-2-hydroxyglutarate oxidase [Desulfuromonadales bacterium]NIS40858.1 L-2-hydroxyglutarate oxidase [Desulfuromonadales bacterium]